VFSEKPEKGAWEIHWETRESSVPPAVSGGERARCAPKKEKKSDENESGVVGIRGERGPCEIKCGGEGRPGMPSQGGRGEHAQIKPPGERGSPDRSAPANGAKAQQQQREEKTGSRSGGRKEKTDMGKKTRKCDLILAKKRGRE